MDDKIVVRRLDSYNRLISTISHGYPRWCWCGSLGFLDKFSADWDTPQYIWCDFHQTLIFLIFLFDHHYVKKIIASIEKKIKLKLFLNFDASFWFFYQFALPFGKNHVGTFIFYFKISRINILMHNFFMIWLGMLNTKSGKCSMPVDFLASLILEYYMFAK